MGSFIAKPSWPVWLLVLSLSGLISACDLLITTQPSSLAKIQERGKIVMITQNSSNTYYLYRDEPHGFEYELARELGSCSL